MKALRQVGSTEKEIALVLGYSYIGFRKRKKNDVDLQEALDVGEAMSKVSLRKALFSKAIDAGNVTAMIWLSKQILGMKDKVETSESSGPTGVLIVPEAVSIEEWTAKAERVTKVYSESEEEVSIDG